VRPNNIVDASIPTSTPLDNELTPLPALLRRKGLTALKGSFASLMGFVQLLQDGLTREEFGDAIKRENPKLGQQSVGTVIHTVSKEFDLCTMESGIFRLSARGLNLLGSQDPDELCDHLLTKILGVDNIIVGLREGPQTKSNLHDLLKSVNPGWTSPFAPSSLLGWLTSLQVVESAKSQQYQLTERGRRWAELITWSPQSLPSNSVEKVQNLSPDITALTIPDFSDIEIRLEDLVAGKLSYPPRIVKELHAGLWFHPVRHFAVLTGISGSGKTQLALNYALALCEMASNAHNSVRIIPVQPGWFDATPMLGHVNVLNQTYRSAPFLDLLLEAADDPTRPYVAILDEINLSHPEQYLAPILSAMETQGWIDLHQLGDASSEVPEKIQYPSNLAIIGTLNMDETTHGLSDKVLDRWFTSPIAATDVRVDTGWMPEPARRKCDLETCA
jgi:5-methylcytosine-specific restriction protein B